VRAVYVVFDQTIKVIRSKRTIIASVNYLGFSSVANDAFTLLFYFSKIAVIDMLAIVQWKISIACIVEWWFWEDSALVDTRSKWYVNRWSRMTWGSLCMSTCLHACNFRKPQSMLIVFKWNFCWIYKKTCEIIAKLDALNIIKSLI
jgi:hypothetical protein